MRFQPRQLTVLVCLLAMGVGRKDVSAQPPASPPPSIPAQPSTVAGVLDRVRQAYSQPVAERVALTLRPLTGPTRGSRIDLLVARAKGDQPPRLVLRLGLQLHAEVIDRRLRVVHTQNATSFFEAELAEPVTVAGLRGIVPPVPIPQPLWGLDAPHGLAPDELDVPPLGRVRFDRVVVEGPLSTLSGTGPAGAAQLTFDADGRLVRCTGVQSGSRQVNVDMTVTRLDPSLPDWAVKIDGRQPVGSLSELKAQEGEVAVGARAPSIGLMTAALEAWSAPDALTALTLRAEESGTGPAVAALVLYRASSQPAEDAALLATGLLHAVKKDTDQRRRAGNPTLPRILIRPVAMLEVNEVRPARIREMAEDWVPAGDELLWSSGGEALIHRFAPRSDAVVVFLDAEHIVQGVSPLGEGSSDALATALRAVVAELATRGK